MKHLFKGLIIINCSFLIFNCSNAQFTHQDTLRGTLGKERTWWNVLKYEISVFPDFLQKTITGKTSIQYKVVEENHSDYLQIDLQQPLKVDTIFYDGKLYINYPGKPYYNEGNVWHVPLPKSLLNSIHSISIAYSGKPREAVRPPWDGGWIFTKDEKGRPWMTVACQGLGASVWFPCKDHQSDEPDNGSSLTIIVPDTLTAIANGRLKEKTSLGNGTTSWTWEVKNPINNYTIIPYIGKYVTWHDEYAGEKGKLDCEYWVIDYNLSKAKEQFKQVPMMLRAFEYWFGPYPFYEDGYKLIESSHLGMEHQSAVAYGNHFINGYYRSDNKKGTDLSGTGWGLLWDFIIVHESGHEWFGNNITTNDIADMWVHEGFTNYSETLFTDYHFGIAAGNDYCIGTRSRIQNDIPIIGPYGVNQEGSGDMYYKGGNLLHTIRQVINNDEKFRLLLRNLNKDFYHRTTTSQEIEKYISVKSGIDFSKIFDQYLRTIKIPLLEYKINKTTIAYHWADCADGFNLPVKLTDGSWLSPTPQWKEIPMKENYMKGIDVDRNFYVLVKKVK